MTYAQIAYEAYMKEGTGMKELSFPFEEYREETKNCWRACALAVIEHYKSLNNFEGKERADDREEC